MRWTNNSFNLLGALGCAMFLALTAGSAAGEQGPFRTAQHRGDGVPVRSALLQESDRQQVKYESVQRRGRGWYGRGATRGGYRGPNRVWTNYRRPGVYIGGPRVGVYYQTPRFGYYPPRLGYGAGPYRSYYYRW